MKARKALAISAAAALVGINLASDAFGVTRSWNVGSAIFGGSGNWTPAGSPTSADILYLNRLVGGDRGRATVSGNGWQANSVSIRQLNELNIANNSSLNVGGDILVGYDDSVGFLNVNGPSPGIVPYTGNLTIGNTLRLGFGSGSGIVNQNDGTVTVNQLLRVGDRHLTSTIFPGTGRYNLSGVGVLNVNRLELGYGGDQSQFACEGELNISGNAVMNINLSLPQPRIGGNGGEGVLNQTGGTLNCTQRIMEFGGSAIAGGFGIFNYSGGVFNAQGVHLNDTAQINYNAGANLDLKQISTLNGKIYVNPGGEKTLRSTVLWTNPGAWRIDLNDNQMVVMSTFGDGIEAILKRGRANGFWDGTGIFSSVAANESNHVHTLGMMSGVDYKSIHGGTATFGGITPGDAHSLIKFTLYGDTDFNGDVNFDDYSRIDAGFNNTRTGWINGDFDMSGDVNFDDYALIDLAFNSQSGTLGTALAFLHGDVPASKMNTPELQKVVQHFNQFGVSYSNAVMSAVPEPASLSVLAAAALGTTVRRRRERK